jgi:hypothetical protein
MNVTGKRGRQKEEETRGRMPRGLRYSYDYTDRSPLAVPVDGGALGLKAV